MHINTVAVGLVVEPLAFEDVAVDVPEFSIATGLVEAPIALVFGAVFPNLHAVAVLQVSEPLADVCRAILKMNFWSLFKLGFVDLSHIELLVKLPV